MCACFEASKPYLIHNMKKTILLMSLIAMVVFQSCNDEDKFVAPEEDPSTFSLIKKITIGGEGAAEITAYDKSSFRLFVVNNADDSKIDVVDFSDPATMSVTSSISITSYGGGVNSVAVGGKYLAAAIEANTSTDPGKIVVWNLSDLSEAAVITAGALPDMVKFSPNEQFILSANEGEPSGDYSIDPKGSVTIVSVSDFSAKTLEFTSFNSEVATLATQSFRVSGPNADLDEDVEPEYIAVSPDSKTAFVTLQENNGVAVIDLETQTIDKLMGLGLKDYSAVKIDPSDEDGGISFRTVPSNIYGVYMPDAISAFQSGGVNYFVTANEGDGREYIYDADEATCTNAGHDFDDKDGCFSYVDEERLKKVDLDPTAFPDAESLQLEENFGRLKMMITNGDTDGDGDYDQIWSYGARSFSIFDENGSLIFDSGDEIETKVNAAGLYDDGRSDDKGVEPEGVVIGEIKGKTIAFIGLERVDAVAIYDISVPASPTFLSVIETGDAPEGLVFISAEDSPTGKSILVVSCEDDGTIWAYTPNM